MCKKIADFLAHVIFSSYLCTRFCALCASAQLIFIHIIYYFTLQKNDESLRNRFHSDSRFV